MRAEAGAVPDPDGGDAHRLQPGRALGVAVGRLGVAHERPFADHAARAELDALVGDDHGPGSHARTGADVDDPADGVDPGARAEQAAVREHDAPATGDRDPRAALDRRRPADLEPAARGDPQAGETEGGQPASSARLGRRTASAPIGAVTRARLIFR